MADEENLDQQVEETAEALAAEEEEKEESLEDKLKEAIDVKVEEVGDLRKKLTIAVPRDILDERLGDQYDELRREAMVPGFRKGRAPRRLLEKRFGGEVSETLVQQLVGTGYSAALDKTDLKVMGDPLIWVKEEGAETETLVDVQKAIDVIKLPAEGNLEFSCEVEVRPEFDMPETEGIELEKPVVTVSDEDVSVQVDRLRAYQGTYDPVVDEAIQADDMVTADIKMTSGDTVLKEQEAVRLAARSQVIDGVSLEKLGEVLTGAKVGEVKTTSGQIADDYVKVEFRGKQADFEITIRDVQRLRMPELDENFLKGFGVETEQELRDLVKRDMESRVGEEVARGMAGQVCKYLLDNTSFELPGRLSERQTDRVMIRHMLDLYQQGVPPAEVEKLTDEMKTSAKGDAIRDLKLTLIMEKLAEDIEVDVSESEINGRIAAIAQRQGKRFDRVRDELAKGEGLMNIYVQIRDEKIIAQLVEKAKVTETKPEAEAKEGKKTSKAASSGEAKKDDTATKRKRPARKPPAKKKGEEDFTDET